MATLTRRQGCINMFSVILMCLVLSRKIRNTIRWSNTYCYQTMLLMTKLFDLSFELNLDEELGASRVSHAQLSMYALPTRERLDHCETRKSYYCPRSFRKMPHRRTRDTEPLDRILHSAIQSQGQWRSISTGLSPDRHRR